MNARSLELNWLRRHDRSLVVPEVLFLPQPETNTGKSCGGFYAKPENQEWFIGGQFVDGRFGVIVIGTDDPELIPGAIAHEWRHHWQLFNGMPLDSARQYEGCFAGRTYEAGIKNYFTHFKSERDALIFQSRVADDWCADYWRELSGISKREMSA